MTINELVRIIKHIALDKMSGIKSFYVGNTWDMSQDKGNVYPNLWLEMPILINYTIQNKLTKEFSFSIDILDLPKLDDTLSEIDRISHCERLCDEFLFLLQQDIECKKEFSLVDLPSGLSVKAINADNACGIRLDIKVNSQRICLKDCK
jgi:hypothetical protein